MEAALAYKGPTYIRVGKSNQGNIHTSNDFAKAPGIHEVMKADKTRPVIMATGSMVKVAQKMIEKEFKGFGLCSVTQIKPFDTAAFTKYTNGSELIISIEEHCVYGGLGSAIAEFVTSIRPKKVLRLGIEDRFSDKCGTYEYLMVEHNLDEKSLIQKIKSVI